MSGDTKAELVAEGIDTLINMDFRSRELVHKIYEAARILSDGPLTLKASKQISEVLEIGGTAFIVTGFNKVPENVQESDGPPGAASLARGLNLSFEARPLLLIQENGAEIMEATLRGIGMNTCTMEELKVKNTGFAAVDTIPLDQKLAEEKARGLIDEYKPRVIIAIEAAGRNRKKVYHNGAGFDITHLSGKAEPLFELAQRNKILTISIIDRGNEVGAGGILGAVREYVPYGRQCQCPCNEGTASESEVDIIVTANSCNWGGYGICAMLAYLRKNPNILHTPESEETMIKACIDAGAMDFCRETKYAYSGFPSTFHSKLVYFLKEFVGAKGPVIL